MIELSRTVRFCINLERTGAASSSAIHNAFASWPSMAGIGAFYELDVLCRGEPDPQTGYLMNISVIDKAVRDRAIPLIEQAVQDDPQQHPARVVSRVLEALQPPLHHTIKMIRWRLSPYYCVAMRSIAPDQVLMSQQFEFSASHRLHVPDWDDARNREVFGKCNNVNSHGHNYRLEVTVAMSADAPSDQLLALGEMERIVDETIIQRFDHKHLNLDTREFASLNPSVENIAKVCYELLSSSFSAKAGGAKIVCVKVWETEKTSCTYPSDF